MGAAFRVLSRTLLLLAATSCAEIPTAPVLKITYRGSLLTRDGAPVADATVIFSHTTGEPRSVGAKTDVNGSFALVVAQGDYRAAILPPRNTPLGLPTVYVEAVHVRGENEHFEYKYQGARVEGKVTGPHGEVVDYADLYFDGPFVAEGRTVHVHCRTYDGTFRTYLPPNIYQASAGPVQEVTGIPGLSFRNVAVTRDTTMDVALVGRRVTGHSTGPDGAPLPYVTIYYYNNDSGASVNSGADGAYELFVPDGVYETETFPSLNDRDVQARTFGYKRVDGDVVYDLAFTGTWWQGTVRDLNGSPVAGISVNVSIVGTYYNARSARVTTDALGHYRVSVVRGAWHSIGAYDASHSGFFGPIPAGADSTLDLTVQDSPSQLADVRPMSDLPRRDPRAGRGAAE